MLPVAPASRAAAGLLIVLAGAFPATAEDASHPTVNGGDRDHGWYVAGKGGPTFARLSGIQSTAGASVTDDNASNAIGAFGMAGGYEWMYRFNLPLRTEFEFMNRTEVTYNVSPLFTNAPSGALASTAQNVTGMLKAYWHFPVDSALWWPFVSGGIGWSHNTARSQYTPSGGSPMKLKESSDDLAWSAGIGATFKLGPQVMNDVELRFVDLGKVNWGLPAGANVRENKIGGFSALELSFAIRYLF